MTSLSQVKARRGMRSATFTRLRPRYRFVTGRPQIRLRVHLVADALAMWRAGECQPIAQTSCDAVLWHPTFHAAPPDGLEMCGWCTARRDSS